ATGALPFRIGEVSTAYERADGYRRIVHDEPDLTGVRDPAIRSLVAACLAKDPAARPTAATLVTRLGETQTGDEPAAHERPAAVDAVLAVPLAPPPPPLPAGPQERKTLMLKGIREQVETARATDSATAPTESVSAGALPSPAVPAAPAVLSSPPVASSLSSPPVASSPAPFAPAPPPAPFAPAAPLAPPPP
ncbi:hypothetical protein P8605_43610, partial [Streptomyces sp. T-3]|nr:hypothetical protein [Streptomyces sp. T-3]